MLLAILIGAIARLTVFAWTDPWGPHHPDEHILPLEALALWEGVTPQEIGWPGSTTMFVLSAAASGQWLIEEGRETWRHRAEPDYALHTVATWIAHRYVDPTPLYKLGRMTSVITGILQLLVLAWALRRWVGPAGVAFGTLAVAMSPMAVLQSQYVLADIAGLLFATIVIGLAARPTRNGVLAMAACAALAAASKFHFGLWLFAAPLCIFLHPDGGLLRKLWRSTGVVAVSAWVVVTAVPWLWINPLLALKEITVVVVDKVVGGTHPAHVEANIVVAVGALGMLTWLGAILGVAHVARDWRRLAPILAPMLFGTAVLAVSGTVFDRYGLVLLPGLALLAALGWERWCSAVSRTPRLIARAAVVVSIAATTASLISAERQAGQLDVDVQAKQWLLSHVARGKRIAVWDESNAFLPRTRQQLLACVQHVETPEAYREKMLVEGVDQPVGSSLPLRSVVLNDERFHAYWCQRALDVQEDPGFWVVDYHNEPRFGAALERDVLSDFRSGAQDLTGGVDVLVMNRPVDVGIAPAQILRNERGERVIYVR